MWLVLSFPANCQFWFEDCCSHYSEWSQGFILHFLYVQLVRFGPSGHNLHFCLPNSFLVYIVDPFISTLDISKLMNFSSVLFTLVGSNKYFIWYIEWKAWYGLIIVAELLWYIEFKYIEWFSTTSCWICWMCSVFYYILCVYGISFVYPFCCIEVLPNF